MLKNKKLTSSILIICSALSILSPAVSAAEIKEQFSYQGKLTTNAGVPVNETKDIAFRLYDGDTCVWSSKGDFSTPELCKTSGFLPVDVRNGLFTVMLGGQATNSFKDFDFAKSSLSLEIQIKDDAPMTPRKDLGAVPQAFFAMKAANADNAKNALNADNAKNALNADNALNALNADNAKNASSAATALTADKANSANRADSAGKADNATQADRANSAGSADIATKATDADNAKHALTADLADKAKSLVDGASITGNAFIDNLLTIGSSNTNNVYSLIVEKGITNLKGDTYIGGNLVAQTNLKVNQDMIVDSRAFVNKKLVVGTDAPSSEMSFIVEKGSANFKENVYVVGDLTAEANAFVDKDFHAGYNSTSKNYNFWVNSKNAVFQTNLKVNGSVLTTSDERLKKNIVDYDAGLEEIKEIRPISYNWSDDFKPNDDSLQSGFSAQNIQSVLPEAVVTDDEGYLAFNDRPILAALVNAIKELSSKIDDLVASVAKLEGKTVVPTEQEIAFGGSELLAGDARVTENLNVEGQLTAGKDTAGYAIIKAGEDRVTVVFAQSYKNRPVVNLNVVGRKDVEYYLDEVTADGFTIYLKNRLDSDVEFSWLSLGVE